MYLYISKVSSINTKTSRLLGVGFRVHQTTHHSDALLIDIHPPRNVASGTPKSPRRTSSLVFKKTFNVCDDVDVDKRNGHGMDAGEKWAFYSLGERRAEFTPGGTAHPIFEVLKNTQ